MNIGILFHPFMHKFYDFTANPTYNLALNQLSYSQHSNNILNRTMFAKVGKSFNFSTIKSDKFRYSYNVRIRILHTNSECTPRYNLLPQVIKHHSEASVMIKGEDTCNGEQNRNTLPIRNIAVFGIHGLRYTAASETNRSLNLDSKMHGRQHTL